VGAAIREAISSYATEVRSRTFPAPEHTYAVKDDPKAAKVKTKSKTSA
jgi:3-methyl-2-oxobutanoate hydroxymethyltransferase